MDDDYKIHLNFLAIDELPTFRVFRKHRLEGEPRPSPDTASYSFAIEGNSEQRSTYWVRWDATVGYAEYWAEPSENNDLTRAALFQSLASAAAASLAPTEYVRSSGFIDELSFIMRRHKEGNEVLVVQPYFLREAQQFGLLAGFHFRKADDCAFSRRVQQLSLSLDRQYRRNIDFYFDWASRVQAFLNEREQVFSTLKLPGNTRSISLTLDFKPLPARRLRSRLYVFANDRESKSQFSGLRDFGPLKPLDQPPNLLFVFREQDRPAARTLAAGLKGSKTRERFSFPGFQSLFKSALNIDSKPVILPDVSQESMVSALSEVRSRRALDPSILPVVVLPDGDDNGYLAHKAGFTNAGIATQVCTLPIILDDNALKWAIANIALQVFCKAGGLPWKVRPSSEPTLIVGISQSHKIRKSDDGRSIVDKYFAFTVMTDNSGLFQNIQVLGEAGDKTDYLAQLNQNLSTILATESQRFSRVVVHTSFKLKREEINAIQTTVAKASQKSVGDCRFAVVKVNHKCRFFGTNRRVNSLVPYEGTIVRLGGGEYLSWFEGIFPDKPTVNRRYSGPSHLQFLRVSDDKSLSDNELLQDLVNLSGANWRGFNAKSAPVSVFYCHLVADVVHNFHDLGLPLPEVQVFRPWFL
ncbi:Piwi domain-containing protein [Anatilimnocola floriformis]|uniref:Piwi domain-containing protein n=1 Tax=Anatilimnocola floriformis TaxID=2948575 RepID=UPI0020C2840D|nr:Piwi domain-containing protein [Anatilimnocola floriformis]